MRCDHLVTRASPMLQIAVLIVVAPEARGSVVVIPAADIGVVTLSDRRLSTPRTPDKSQRLIRRQFDHQAPEFRVSEGRVRPFGPVLLRVVALRTTDVRFSRYHPGEIHQLLEREIGPEPHPSLGQQGILARAVQPMRRVLEGVGPHLLEDFVNQLWSPPRARSASGRLVRP